MAAMGVAGSFVLRRHQPFGPAVFPECVRVGYAERDERVLG
ncbi:hypothetical protein HNQ58_000441 [Rehaibacterium terrae]|uniref:Uncharacterized protein n=1 Tax=Rehaibacterium terrae TaxID=1341696 RepID=A0A7W7V7H6_9GAMM|nr:hypothetical protein [Rehaibacterium terrae]